MDADEHEQERHAGRGRLLRRSLLGGATVSAVVAGALFMGDRAPWRAESRGDRPPASGVSWAPADERSTSPSPFAVGWLPEGFDLVVAGTGDEQPLWGEDEVGTTEPFTVLAPTGEEPTPQNTAIVSVTGYAGYPDHVADKSAAYPEEEGQSFRVKGRPAYFAPADPEHDHRPRQRADLVVAVEEDLAIRVAGSGRSRDELVALVERVTPRGQVRAPEVDPPDGMEVAAWADADLVLTRHALVDVRHPEELAPDGALAAGWQPADTGPDGEARQTELAVTTLRGTSGDPAALLGWHPPRGNDDVTTSTVAVGSRRGVVEVEEDTDCGEPCPYRRTVLMTTTGWGDLLVVHASGAAIPSPADLARIAASVSPVDDEAWEAFVVGAAGGPGLHPDPGMVEVVRGNEDGVEWLLQAYPNGSGHDRPDPDISLDQVPAGAYVADLCLKLGNRQRLCASGQATLGTENIVRSSHPGVGADAGAEAIEGLVVVDTAIEATAMRVRAGDQEVVAPLHRLPGEVPRWAGVAFVDRPGIAGCREGEPAAEPGTVRVDLLDADGGVIRCVGIIPP